jgi:glycogen(starch) synthase
LFTIPADIIHLHIGGRLTARLLALCLICSLFPRRRVVLTFHSGGYPSWQDGQNAHPRSLRGFVLRRFDAIIAVNAEIAALFQRLGVAACRVRIICPYAPVSVHDDVAVPDEIRRFSDAHSPLLTTVGLLEPEYDLPLQIRTLAMLRQIFPEAGLMILGSGSLEAELRALIAREPVGPHVLLCGDVPHAATVRVISESDAFLRTTLYDGDSVSVREALQLGVPVVATDNGMRPPRVHLVPRSDAVALCRAIEGVLREPARHMPVGTPANDDHVEKVLELYSGLFDSRTIVPSRSQICNAKNKL